jgi:hypothetical protein
MLTADATTVKPVSQLTLTKFHLGFEFLDLMFQENLVLNGLCMAGFPVSNLRTEYIGLLC